MGVQSSTFGPFTLRDGALLRDGNPVAAGQRGLALLRALLSADGPVDKAILMEAAWPGAIVEEGNLTVQIAALRKVLGERPDGSDWIVTVPRVGYRLVGRSSATASTEPSLPVLAVLPFDSFGADPDAAGFADGLVEELIAALSRFKALRLLARGATNRFRGATGDLRDIARDLGADYLVEGSVRRGGEQFRIAVRLAVGDNGANVWGHTFEGKVTEVFALQDRVASTTAAQASRAVRQAELDRSTKERPSSSHAYDLVQRGTALLEALSDTASRNAITLLEQAVALEPQDAAALAAAAWGYEQRIHAGWTTEPAEEERCLQLARAAISAGGGDANILGHCGIALQLCGGEWEHGLQTTLRGVEINPSSTAALFFGGVAHLTGGTLEGARDLFERARSFAADDEAGNPWGGLAHVLICEGRFEEALALADRAVVMRPQFFWVHWAVIAANAQLRRMDAAHEALAIYRAVDSAATLRRIRNGQRSRDPGRHTNLIEGLRLAGMPE